MILHFEEIKLKILIPIFVITSSYWIVFQANCIVSSVTGQILKRKMERSCREMFSIGDLLWNLQYVRNQTCTNIHLFSMKFVDILCVHSIRTYLGASSETGISVAIGVAADIGGLIFWSEKSVVFNCILCFYHVSHWFNCNNIWITSP